jgi:hypothetical protein
MRSATSDLTQGLTAHLDPMSVVEQPVEDAIRQRGIPDLLPGWSVTGSLLKESDKTTRGRAQFGAGVGIVLTEPRRFP